MHINKECTFIQFHCILSFSFVYVELEKPMVLPSSDSNIIALHPKVEKRPSLWFDFGPAGLRARASNDTFCDTIEYYNKRFRALDSRVFVC